MCGFLGVGGEEKGAAGGVCCEACFEAASVVCEWEGIFFCVALA